MRQYFEELFGGMEKGEYIELRHQPDPKSRSMTSVFVRTVDEAVSQVQSWGSSGHSYVGVAPRHGKGKGTKSAIRRLLYFWIDIDQCRELPSFVFAPTIVVDSGHGFHCYWKLTEPTTDLESAEEYMKNLAVSVGGDKGVHDVARILRIPGTMNYKHEPPVECTLVSCRPELQYDAFDLGLASKVPEDIRQAIGSEGNAGKHSRSERDWAIVTALFRLGFSKETVDQIFRTSPCGNKMMEEPEYWERTLAKASKSLAALPTNDALAALFAECDDRYCVATKGVQVPISTFVFQPQALIEHTQERHEDAILGVLKASGYTWPSAVLTKKAFNNVGELNKQIPQAACQWLGSDRQLRALLPHLMQQLLDRGLPKVKATATLGRFEDYWVGTDQVVSAVEVTEGDSRPVQYLNEGREVPKTHYPVLSTLQVARRARDVFPHLWKLNTTESIVPMLGWLYCAPFKTKLWEMLVRFPILNVFGTRGSGKTVTITRVLLPLLGVIDKRSYDSGTTNFVLLSLMGSTNAIPVSLSEFRLSSVPRITRYLLLSYDSGRDARGRADQTTQQYALTSPLIVDGEDALADPALKERIIQVRLCPETISDGSPAEQAFRALEVQPLEELATSYIQYTLKAKVKWKEANSLVREAFGERVMPDRVRQNLAIGVHGLLHLNAWLEGLGVGELGIDLVPNKVFEYFEPCLLNIVERSGRTSLLADEFVEAVINEMATMLNREPKFTAAWYQQNNAAAFQLSSAYAWWSAERRKQGRVVLEQAALRAQLQERMLDLEHPRPGQYLLSHGGCSVRGTTFWMYKVSLPDAREAGLDVPDTPPTVMNITLNLAPVPKEAK